MLLRLSLLGFAAVVGTLLGLLSGCSSNTVYVPAGNPTSSEVSDAMTPPYCARLERCNASGFASTFPMGQSECVAKQKAAIASQPQNVSACTRAQLKICTSDMASLPCNQSDASGYTESCKRC